ncbi:MAG: TonB-dependent receptor [Bacteroidetes bacterium B1(2017)]|nr:MAG: TonB-dependent receptor [Bacteroidetes bacterium B1(2017)]
MRKNYKKFLLSTTLCLASLISMAQMKTITGQVKDETNAAMPGAVVTVQGTSIGNVCDENGNYKLSFDVTGMEKIVLNASMVGYEKSSATIDANADASVQNFSLKQDQLGLKELVVTGVTNAKSKLESSVSISTIRAENINQSAPRTTAEIFRAIPGIRSEASAGDGNTNITVRGVPISSGGSKYLQLQEDGLPVLQFGDIAFATSDIFLRADQTVSRIEAIRGGSASTMSSNSPAGIINFISKTGEVEGGSFSNTIGVDYKSYRTDFDYGSPINKDLSFHIGGFYRTGEGVRTSGYNANNGGQLKASLTRKYKNGYARVYAKFLNDRAAAYMPMPIEVSGTNANPVYKGMANFDPLTGTIHSAYLQQSVGFGANGELRRADVSDGMHPMSKAIGAEFNFDLGEGWSVENRGRFSVNNGNFIAPFPANVGSTSSMLTAMNSAMGWTLTNPKLTYADNGQAFTGDNAMLVHMFDVELRNFNLFANDFKLKKKVNENFTVNAGVYKSMQTVSMAWVWNSYLMDVNGNGGRLINVDTGATRLTSNGQFAYGVPAWGNCCTRSYDTKYDITAPYAGVAFEVKDLSVDASIRYDMGHVTGSFAGSAQSTKDMNNDGVISASELSVSSINYANSSAVNYKYNYVSYSAGANYKVTEQSAVFARYSTGASAKADRILFSSSILAGGDARATYDEISQGEFGYKLRHRKGGLFITGFYANVNEQGGYEATTQKVIENDYKSMGLELEGTYAINKNFDLRGSLTYTKATITSGANKNNTPRRQAPVIYNFFANYKLGKHAVGLNFFGTAKSFTQDDNKLVMPAYLVTNAYVNFALAKNLNFSVNANNLLNSLGITESEEGSITENQTNIIRARSIMGRSISATLRLAF